VTENSGSQQPADCTIIENLMVVRLFADERDRPAIDEALVEIKRLRALLARYERQDEWQRNYGSSERSGGRRF